MQLFHMPPPSNLSIASISQSSPPSIEPTSFSEANKRKVWHDAMALEMNALLRNGTWTLVPF